MHSCIDCPRDVEAHRARRPRDSCIVCLVKGRVSRDRCGDVESHTTSLETHVQIYLLDSTRAEGVA